MPRGIANVGVGPGRMAAGVVVAASVAWPALGQAGRLPQDEIVYQIMPIAWRDSNNDTQGTTATRFGDFGGLASAGSLDYLQYLGVTMIYLQPIFPSAAYHGYQHGPADQLNSRFGTEAQFLAFVNAAHARGMKVILDYVAYGISQNSVYYTSAYNNPASPYDLWLGFTNAANTQYTGSVYNTWNGASVGFIHWNLANPSAVSAVTGWALKWLDPNGDGDTSDGVDGFRLDHAYSNAPEGWGATIGFWQTWCSSLRAVKPGVFIFCEPGDWGNYGADLLTPSGFDAVLTKPWEFAARDAVKFESASGLYSSMAATVAAVPAGKAVVAQTNDHDSDRLSSYIGGSFAKQKVAAAVLMTQPYPPSIYFGDELAMRGTKGNWGSDANDIPMREPFKWLAAAGAPMSNYWILNSSAYNNRTSRNNDGRSVQEQQGVAGSVLEAYRSLIAARRGSVALRRGSYIPVTNSSPAVWAFVRAHADQKVLVAINLSGAAVNASLNLGAFGVSGGSTVPADLLTGALLPAITTANRGAYGVSLPAYSYTVSAVGLIEPAPPPPPPADVDGRNIPAEAGAFALRATQGNPTSLGDNIGELDQLFVKAADNGLRIGVTGNAPTDGSAIVVFIEANPGGQNVLNTANQPSPPSGLAQMSGTTLDTGFAPDHLFFLNFYGGAIYADQVALTATTSIKTYRGQGQMNSGVGLLSGGTNPSGLAVAMDNTNTAGVTATSAAGAATAARGLEMLIPYADVGLPTEAASRAGRMVRVAAAIVRPTGQFTNQWLPGLPAGTPDIGLQPSLNNYAGAQFAAVVLPPVGDVNGDGVLNAEDLYAWYAAPIDVNGDGTADAADALAVEAAIRAGESAAMLGPNR
ncbi:MAG: alpha-glucosidase C-terminal domain-containing protein [Phycisphaerales bacterium]|nr:alpha-glucosidase C-terminal domain-containing protein [Phycisphaerales bacterium]